MNVLSSIRFTPPAVDKDRSYALSLMASGMIFHFITLHEKQHELERLLCRSLHCLATCAGCLHLRGHLFTGKVLERASQWGPRLRGELSLVLLLSSLISRALRFRLHAFISVSQEILSQNLISIIYTNISFCTRAGDQAPCLSAPGAISGYYGGLLGVTDSPVTSFLFSYCVKKASTVVTATVHCGKRYAEECTFRHHTTQVDIWENVHFESELGRPGYDRLGHISAPSHGSSGEFRVNKAFIAT
ncbi:hypothetical protein N431DRAFT_136993 [Stipitochalara longipes BDJ]|nr:hypothetical protein N431DRAFT_136993 [Stipitochalara longipes BDJ]